MYHYFFSIHGIYMHDAEKWLIEGPFTRCGCGCDFFCCNKWVALDSMVSVHTAAAVAMVLQVNGFGTHFVRRQQRHHEGSSDSGTLKSLNFSNFWTF